MIGTGEYTTGYGQESAKSDKGAGVVALTMFDLKSRGKTDRLALCGGSHPSSVPTAVLISAGARRRIVCRCQRQEVPRDSRPHGDQHRRPVLRPGPDG
jgi:hypothetical protein